MVGTRTTNPFDDDDNLSSQPSALALASTNPFESGYASSGGGADVSDDEPAAMSSGNSYSSHGVGGMTTDEDEDYDDDDDDDDQSNDDNANAPVEASWQFLGDLPYRRITLYKNIQWGKKLIKVKDDDDDDTNYTYETSDAGDDPLANNGLTSIPPSYLESQRRTGLDESDLRKLLSTTTTTKVAGCPNGGPIAAITCGTTAALSTTELRIMTSSGRPLAKVEFPPRSLAHNPQKRIYTSSDVLTIGFTDRCILVVVMRDSLCLTYDVSGNSILPPFHIIPEDFGSKRGPGSVELMEATVYSEGVAVLSTAMSTAVVELLDEHDDPTYADGAHIAARRVNPEGHGNSGGGGGGPPDASGSGDASTEMFGSARAGVLPPHWAIVTPLPTAAHAQKNYYSYCALAVLPRKHTANGHPELFLSTSDNSVLIVDCTAGGITDVDCRARMQSPIICMSFAPNGRFLACFTENSLLTVISTTFETKVLDFDTSEGSSAPPKDMKWCGEDSVVLHWKNLGVLMVGPYGDWLRFPYEGEGNLHIIPEIDCCRVVTDSNMEMLQRVPPATAELFRIGSIEPSAMLLDASDDFEKGSPSSDEAARAITKTGMLVDAIVTCTEAATREYDIKTQKRLLSAASYGMHFSYKDGSGAIMGGPLTGSPDMSNIKPTVEAAKFVASARKIRVMNALRDKRVGLALTSAQYDAITPTGVIARLIAMKRPALATSICSYLQLDESVQAFARASRAAAFVVSDKGQTDGQTAEAAIKILKEDNSGVRGKGGTVPAAHNRGAYASVALAADRAGRSGVAKHLLMLETSTADKVPALLSIGMFADAASVAVAARDTDLAFLCLVEFQKYCKASTKDQKQAMSTFNQTLVTKFPAEAVNLYMMYLASNQDVKYMMNLLLRKEKFVTAGSAMAKLALDTRNTRERVAMVKEASRVYGLGKESVFQKVSADEYVDLLSEQERLRNTYSSYDVAPESSSITTTISSVIRYAGTKPREAHRLFADAERLAKRFKVPERRLWHIKVRAFSRSGQWANLRNLADSRAKNPIGLKPFALAAIEGKQPLAEITRYIERVPPGEERYDLFCEAKMWKKAIEEAAQMRDPNRIMHVRGLCNSPEIQQLCEEQASRLL